MFESFLEHLPHLVSLERQVLEPALLLCSALATTLRHRFSFDLRVENWLLHRYHTS